MKKEKKQYVTPKAEWVCLSLDDFLQAVRFSADGTTSDFAEDDLGEVEAV